VTQVTTNETKTAKRTDPFATYKFWVEVEGIVGAEFTECSGLEQTIDVFDYQEGGLNEYSHKLPGKIKFSNITLKQGFATTNYLYNWYKQMKENLSTGDGIKLKKVTIHFYSSANPKDSMSWTLNDAFPVKWVGPAFKTGEAAIAVETLEFAHHGIMVD
jgi:phage tail-like protein